MAVTLESTSINMTDKEIDLFLQNSLNEDMPEGDITTDNIIDPNEISYAEFIAKDNGVISGINYAKRTFELIGGNVDFKIYKQEKKKVVKGDLIATIKGNTRTLLKGERNIEKPIHKPQYFKPLTIKQLKKAVTIFANGLEKYK